MDRVPADVEVLHVTKGSGLVLQVAEDGYMGSLFDKGDFELCLTAPTHIDVFKVKEGRISYPRPARVGERNFFEITIPLLNSDKIGRLVTKYPSNHVKVVSVSDSEGSANLVFNLWDIAVTTQLNKNGKTLFFLTKQLCYSSPVFKNNRGQTVMPDYPGYSNWEDLQKHVELSLHGRSVPSLPPPPESFCVSVPLLGENEGEVLWYNLAQGIGAIRTQRSTARVHWSQIVSDDSFRHLKGGQRVTFENLAVPATHKNPQRRTNFKLEAQGVRVKN